MAAAQRMGTGPDGRPIVTKLAPPGPDADGLEAEAEVLRLAAHPGVVEVVGAGRLPDGGFRLDTRLAGTRTLSGLRPVVDEAAGIVAALAATVADLHGLGIVHGAVEPAHVVLDAQGAPILCGFGRGRRVGASTAATDVAGLGEVLAAMIGEAAEIEPIPERRFGRRASWSAAVARRSLLTLADQARAEDLAVRPSARAFAGAVLAAVPTARLRGGPAPAVSAPASRSGRANARARVAGLVQAAVPTARLRGGPAVLAPARGTAADAQRRGSTGPEEPSGGEVATARAGGGAARAVRAGGGAARAVRVAAAVAGLGLLSYGVAAILGRPTGGPAGTGSASTPRAPVSPSGEPTAAPPEATSAETLQLLECPALESVGADPDGDGCPSPVTVDGGVVEVDGVRYGVGAPGDILAVGDWDCDGSATVAAVRPATGEVFVFGGWAAPGEDLVVGVAGHVAGADHAVAEDPDGDGCPALVVLTVDGQRAEVPA